ncbi:TPA: hypothetical protein OUL50_002557 [Clostridioides difficile]|nr:hypothetical protein [Clostridioides difficile]
MSVVTPFQMFQYNLRDKSFYDTVVDFFPFAGGRQTWGWGGSIDGLDGSFEETCKGCSYKNGSFYSWGASPFIHLSGYGEHVITYQCERTHERTGNKYQYTSDRTITLKCEPSISGIDNVLSDKRKGFSIDFSVNDDTPNANLTVYVSLDDKVIQTFNNVANNANLTAIVTDEQINSFTESTHQLKITLNDGYDNFYRTYSFWKKDKGINITSSATDKQAKFTVTKIYSELTKIECYLDETLKETFTTDLYSEKTINYELTDNAIHTLKIVVTDAENVVEEKVISISKEIMPLQSDATLKDISSKLVEIGEGFKNGKTSIINTLALKNIEASLNNTLVELSEKIKTSFDSGDASLQELMNQLTQANNTISQLNSKYKVASGTTTILTGVSGIAIPFDVTGYNYREEYKNWINVSNLGFLPNIFISFEKHKTSSSYPTFYRNLVIACRGIFDKDFSVVSTFSLKTGTGGGHYSATGGIIEINKETPYIDGRGVYLPVSYQDVYTSFNWYAIKFK